MTEESLFLAALERSNLDDRRAFLDDACAGDPGLHRRIEILLAAFTAGKEKLEPPAAANPKATLTGAGSNATSDYCPNLQSGAIVAGRYKLAEKIGEGGMGEVWVAKQTEPIQRKVALKLIKAGMDSQRVLARFDAERQALALMDHPNIAKVLDGGLTADHRPFFVMELVNGQPLTQFCDEAKLNPRERLALFVAICQAVQHAHQKGIVHRDLKPSNVLVTQYDGRPVPKVIDFGVAKATGGKLTDESLSTQFGTVVGTFEYMSPEQAGFSALDVDTRSDIYSLGVILYELLTGLRPFDSKRLRKAAYDEMVRIIREEEPQRPSTKLSTDASLPSAAAVRGTDPKRLTALMKGELDWIVMRCLEKDRNRRYETANGLARDVERYLADEVVEARPPSTRYRMKKFVRRNKGRVIAVGLVILALLGGVIGTTIGMIRAGRSESEARDQAKIAGQERDSADARFRLANDAVEVYLSKVTEDEDLKVSDFNALRRRLLESAVPFYRKLAEERHEAPRQRANQALAHVRLAAIAADVGDLVAAVQEGESARAIYADLPAEASADPQIRNEFGECLMYLCRHLIELGQLELAFVYGNQGRNLLAALVAEDPVATNHRDRLAAVYRFLAIIEMKRGRNPAAIEQFQAAIDIEQKLVAELGTNPNPRHNLAGDLMNLGSALQHHGSFAAAEDSYAKAMAIFDGLAAQYPRNHHYRSGQYACRNNLGATLHLQGKDAAARRMQEDALRFARKLVADFPSITGYRSSLGNVLNNLGTVATNLRQADAAEKYYLEALAVEAKACDDFPRLPEFRFDLVVMHGNLGKHYHRLARLDDSQAENEAAVSAGKRLVHDFPGIPEYEICLADALNGLAVNLHYRGRDVDARTQEDAAIKLLNRLVAEFPEHAAYQLKLGLYWFNIGDHIHRAGKPAEAIEWYDRAIGTLEAPRVQKMGVANARSFLRESHRGRAKAFDELHRSTDADNDWARTLELATEAERPGLRMNRACSRVRVGQIEAPLREVEELLKANADGPRDHVAADMYDASCAYGLAARPLESTPASKREEYAKRSVELLALALAKGFLNIDQIKIDHDLDALRERADFQALLARFLGKPRLAPPPREVK